MQWDKKKEIGGDIAQISERKGFKKSYVFV